MGKYLILACDGGGIRGYITASVIQKLAGDPRACNFLPQVRLTAGTSTGSFIALALAAGKDIAAIKALYEPASARSLFTRNPAISGKLGGHEPPQGLGKRVESLWGLIMGHFDELVDTQYANTGVMAAARSVLGATTTLSQLAPVVVTTLRLADHIAAGRDTPDALAEATGVDGGRLDRRAARRPERQDERVDPDGAVQTRRIAVRRDVRVGGRDVLGRRADLLPALLPDERVPRLLRRRRPVREQPVPVRDLVRDRRGRPAPRHPRAVVRHRDHGRLDARLGDQLHRRLEDAVTAALPVLGAGRPAAARGPGRGW